MSNINQRGDDTFEVNDRKIFCTAKDVLAYWEQKKRSINPELVRELQRAKDLQKGLQDWGDVYSQSSDRWYQKDVETKKEAGERELRKMQMKLASKGIHLTDELPAAIPPQKNKIQQKTNGSRKIFILDEE